MYPLQDWKVNPFLTFGTDPSGLTGGIAMAANGIVFTQSATYNVDRTLSVNHDLNFHQTDYWIESISDPMSLVSDAVSGRDCPYTLSQNLGISGSVSVSGGQTGQSTIHEGTANGPIIAGQTVYMQASGALALTEADDVVKASVAGIAYASGGGIVSGALLYLTDGELTLTDWTFPTGSSLLTPGDVYYLDPSADGKITNTAPTAYGAFVVKVGRALTTTMLDIELGEGVGL